VIVSGLVCTVVGVPVIVDVVDVVEVAAPAQINPDGNVPAILHE
jgi:hypothetical protein